MENKNISLLRRKNRWGLTVLSIVLCLLLSPLMAISAFLPQAMTLVPITLLLLLGYVGPVSAATCTAILFGLSTTFSASGARRFRLLLVPVLVVSGCMVERGRGFWRTPPGQGDDVCFHWRGYAAHHTLAGTDVVTAMSDMMRQAFASSGTIGDTALTAMMQFGLITAADGSAASMTMLDAATREQLIAQLVLAVDTVMRLEIPMQMATGSVAAGVLGQAALRKGVLSRGDKVDYPPLRTWSVPKGWGRVLGATLAALYVLTLVVPSMTSSMFYVFSGVFEQIFALQGIAAVCYYLHGKGRGRVAQGVVFVLGYFLVQPAALLIGIADQTFDVVHRREKMEEERPNPFDPRTHDEQ
ncbi:MAG: DUF2232 domain-containing protein [Christensenellales bacterium]